MTIEALVIIAATALPFECSTDSDCDAKTEFFGCSVIDEPPYDHATERFVCNGEVYEMTIAAWRSGELTQAKLDEMMDSP